MLKTIVNILLYIWQLPQHLVALVIYAINRKSVKKQKCCYINFYFCKHVYDCGISLGNYIFLDEDVYSKVNKYDLETTVRHEHGHQIQSKYLGWFYLFFIGFPSIVGNCVDRILSRINREHHLKNCIYYKLPWEAWADKLGCVDRH